MKNIVFFVESMHCGGAERSLLSLLQNIDSNKYNIDLLVIHKGGEFEKFIPSYINYKSVDTQVSLFQRIKFKLYQKTLSKRHSAQLFWKAVKDGLPLYKKHYDIAVAWGQGYATYYTAEKIQATEKFAWVNIDYEKAGYKKEFDIEIYNKFKMIVGVSEFVKDSMQEFLDKNKVISIRNIIDISDVKERANSNVKINFSEDKINIVSIGRLAKQKAFELSIQAAAILKAKNVQFCWYVIGEGSERAYLEKLIEENKLQHNFILLGFNDNPYPYIKASDIYVQTSLFEGLGRTLIEASILCKPIVTTNFPTAYSILKDNETGIIVPMTAESVAEGISKLISDVTLKNNIIKNLENQVDNGKEKTLEEINDLFA